MKRTRRNLLIGAVVGLLGSACGMLPSTWAADAPHSLTKRPPNFIVILADDMGYSDLGCFGSAKNRTPNMDRMAAEGTRFTSFYVTSGVCSPSRASLMTGCYPMRVGFQTNCTGVYVLCPNDKKGISSNEKTIAQVLKPQGYATGCIGKWHLGDQPEFLPTRHGFDYYYGLPYSNDMGNRPGAAIPLPLLRKETVIEAPAEQDTLTKRYTEQAVAFIRAHKDEPFFLYFPHTMPHSPQHASQAFKGQSRNGAYGDAIEEIDWSAGQLVATLKELGLDEQTLILVTSDNGATRQGSNLPLSGGKATTQEGGMRMPCVMRWPGHIPAGQTCDELCTTMDLLPTFAALAGTKPAADRPIDGRDIRPLLAGEKGVRSPHEAFFYYYMSQLQAVRSGPWKLCLALDPKLAGWDGKPKGKCEAALYNLQDDIGETRNVIAQHPDVVSKLTVFADKARAELGDFQRKGSGQRASGWVEHPQPLRLSGQPEMKRNSKQ
jgi:arylsulfatase A-like enzyme